MVFDNGNKPSAMIFYSACHRKKESLSKMNNKPAVGTTRKGYPQRTDFILSRVRFVLDLRQWFVLFC